MSIMSRIELLRTHLNMSVTEFARKNNIRRNKVTSWEQGATLPSQEVLVKLSKKYAVSVGWLLTGVPAEGNKLDEELSGISAKADTSADNITLSEGFENDSENVEYLVSYHIDEQIILSLYSALPDNKKIIFLKFLNTLCKEDVCV